MVNEIIGVVGMGYVGSKIYDFFKENGYTVHSYDEERGRSDVETIENLNKLNLDFAFVCVPTPMGKNGECDISLVWDVIKKVKAKTIVLESTVAPGTVEMLEKETKKNILFTPEYFGETKNHPLNSLRVRDFFIIGGRPEVRRNLVRLLKDILQSNVKFYLVTSRTAEVIKYMENSFLATKVVFCEEFARICQAFKVDYYEVREGWLLDPRINPSHTFPNKEGVPGFGGKCLPKDVSAIIHASKKAGHNPEFLTAMFNYNTKIRKEGSND